MAKKIDQPFIRVQDHVYPWSLGDEDTFDNLQTLCLPCNSRKGARA